MELTIAIVGPLVVVAGWIVSYHLGQRRDRNLEATRIRLNYVSDQLSLFYGRVYGLLLENDRVRRQQHEQFGREAVFAEGSRLPPDEERLWVHYLENYFLPNNRKIVNLVTEHVHLWAGETVPPSFLAFLDYAVGFESLHRQYHDLEREYGFRYVSNFPEEFRKDIVETVSRLKKLQADLMASALLLPQSRND